ncbi:hypothetical protein P7K49_021492, partial [Saguinus oedipus]
MIKSHGREIKLKTVEEFVQIVRELCPWVPEGGFLDEAAWKFIGEKIDHFSTRIASLPQTDILLFVLPKLRDSLCPIHSSPSAPPYTTAAAFASPPPLPPDPLDLAERGSHHSYAAPLPMDAFETVAEVVVDSSSPPAQWTPGHSTHTLPPDLIHQFRDLLSLCSRSQLHQCFPITQQSQHLGPPVPVVCNPLPFLLFHHCLMLLRPFAEDLQALKLLLHTPLLKLQAMM